MHRGYPAGSLEAVGRGAPVVPPVEPPGSMSFELTCAGCVLPVPRFRRGRCVVPPWPGVLSLPRFRWLVCGSSLSGRLPVPRGGFDFGLDFDLDVDFALDLDFGFDLPSAPLLISPSGCGGEIRNGADGRPFGQLCWRGPGFAGVRGRTVAARCVAGVYGRCAGGVRGFPVPPGHRL